MVLTAKTGWGWVVGSGHGLAAGVTSSPVLQEGVSPEEEPGWGTNNP